jgi:hypothetical protein
LPLQSKWKKPIKDGLIFIIRSKNDFKNI